jgi:hypothetical protein
VKSGGLAAGVKSGGLAAGEWVKSGWRTVEDRVKKNKTKKLKLEKKLTAPA